MSLLVEGVDAFCDSRERDRATALCLLDMFRRLGLDPYMSTNELHDRLAIARRALECQPHSEPPTSSYHSGFKAGWNSCHLEIVGSGVRS